MGRLLLSAGSLFLLLGRGQPTFPPGLQGMASSAVETNVPTAKTHYGAATLSVITPTDGGARFRVDFAPDSPMTVQELVPK